MSIEALLLFAFFILLPMLQQWLQQARQRDRSAPDAARPVPQASRPAEGLPRVPTLRVPRLPEAPSAPAAPAPTIAVPTIAVPTTVPLTTQSLTTESPTISPRPAAARTSAERGDPASKDARTAGRGIPWATLRTRRDLRRAVAVAAILGPCRAVDPYN